MIREKKNLIKLQSIFAVILLAIILLLHNHINAFELHDRPCNLPFEVDVIADLSDDVIESFVYYRVFGNGSVRNQIINGIMVKTGLIIPEYPLRIEFDTRWAVLFRVMPNDLLIMVFTGDYEINYISCWLVIEFTEDFYPYMESEREGA